MSISAPANVLVDKFQEDFKKKFQTYPNLYATKELITDLMGKEMSDFTMNWFNGREFAKLQKLLMATQSKICKYELKHFDDLIAKKDYLQADKYLDHMHSQGTVDTAEYKKLLDTKLVPLKVKLEAEIADKAKKAQETTAGKEQGVAPSGKESIKKTSKTKKKEVRA